MTLTDYLGPRTYRSPYRHITVTVGLNSVLGVLVLGPVYLWRRGAMIEGLLLILAGFALFILPRQGLMANQDLVAGLALGDILELALWVGAALAAPVLLASSYERRGWTDR